MTQEPPIACAQPGLGAEVPNYLLAVLQGVAVTPVEHASLVREGEEGVASS
jgi:hypothetical protein